MQKKKILIFPFDLLSHYLRCITLAESYKDYEILFAFSEKYDPFIKKAGFNSFKVESFDPVEVMKCAAEFNFSWLNCNSIESVLQSQIKVINDLKPYFVIGDTSPTLKMAAEFTKVKYIALMNGYMSKYYSNVRALSITHSGHKHLSKLPENISNPITTFAENIAFKIVHKPFRKIRRKYGLSKITNYLNEMEGDENLLCDEPWLFPQNKLPANYKVIGPLLYASTENEKEFLSTLNPLKPTICVCLGSSGNWNALQFLSEKKYNLFNLVVAGDLNKILQGEHIYHKEFVNLNEILPQCFFMICHGGNGTIYEGIKHKIFMLCLTSHFEQEWNVQQISKLNLGIMINNSPSKYIDKKMEEVLLGGNKKAVVY
ncbi:MAG: hypothetical protein ABIP51_12435 [Bacteroidia bacterium]